MNNRTRGIGTVLVLAILCIAFAQTAAQNPPPSRQQPPPPLRSPEVQQDGRVTFRMRAPNAKEVLLARDGAQRVRMHKDEQGVWSVTTDSLPPDVYPYSFIVDGVIQPDPSNPETKSIYRIALGQSLAHVPGPASLSWEMNDVAHGTIAHHFYKSRIIGDERDYYVYTPPNYDPKRKEPYPVLYLLHGFTDDASAWTTAGRANIILDNLVASGKAKPMIMVNTLGYGAPEIVSGGFGGSALRDPVIVKKNTVNFIAALFQEVIPQVEKSYNARKDREGRAIAGLSMGGAQSLSAGLNYPDKFAYVGGFSSAVVMLDEDFARAFPTVDRKINSQLRVLWVACGTEDFLIDSNRKFKAWLKAKDISFTPIETPGAHTWIVWRRNLTEFAPLLFR